MKIIIREQENGLILFCPGGPLGAQEPRSACHRSGFTALNSFTHTRVQTFHSVRRDRQLERPAASRLAPSREESSSLPGRLTLGPGCLPWAELRPGRQATSPPSHETAGGRGGGEGRIVTPGDSPGRRARAPGPAHRLRKEASPVTRKAPERQVTGPPSPPRRTERGANKS